MIEGDLDRADVARADYAVLRRFSFLVERRDDNRRPDPAPTPGKAQGAIAFHQRKEVSTTEAGLMVANGEIEDRLTALFCRCPSELLPALGQFPCLGGGFQFQPTVETIEVTFNRNKSTPGLTRNSM